MQLTTAKVRRCLSLLLGAVLAGGALTSVPAQAAPADLPEGAVPLYELYSDAHRWIYSHLPEEVDALETEHGMEVTRIVGYVLPEPAPGTVELHRLAHEPDNRRIITSNPEELERLREPGGEEGEFIYGRSLGFVLAPDDPCPEGSELLTRYSKVDGEKLAWKLAFSSEHDDHDRQGWKADGAVGCFFQDDEPPADAPPADEPAADEPAADAPPADDDADRAAPATAITAEPDFTG